MKRLLVSLGLVVVLLGSGVAAAQTPTPRPMPLPWGWGPADQIYIISDQWQPEGDLTYFWDTNYPCNEALVIHKNGGSLYWPELTIRLTQEIPSTDLRLRMIMGANIDSFIWPFQTWPRLQIKTYRWDGTLIATQEYWWDDLEPFAGYATQDWRVFDRVITAHPAAMGYVRIQPQGSYLTAEAWTLITGLYVTDNTYGFPDLLCGQSPPTLTPTPTPTNVPTWTPTGTLTPMSPTPTFTPVPTATSATGTPTPTPVPYVTWTPTVSPTPWQSPAPTLFSTPTPADILPTWPAWPTVAWPAVSSVTPYPTRIWDELTTTPVATATPFTPTVDYDTIISNTLDLTDDINFPQVYQASQSLINTISYPIRVIRGTVRTYMPGLAFLVDALITMLFLVAAVYAIKVILAAVGAVVKLIEVIMEFIPL